MLNDALCEPVEVAFARRVAAAAATLLVVAYLAGGAFGIAPAPAVSHVAARVRSLAPAHAPRRTRTTGHGPDVAHVVETVSHHITPDAAHPGVLVAHDGAYTVRFARSGFTLAPSHASQLFAWSLTHAGRTDTPNLITAHDWHAVTNVASRTVQRATIERVTAHNDHVEWDLVLSHQPAGTGAYVIDASVHNADIVTLGMIRVRDASGTTIWRAPTRVVAGHVSLQLPASLLDHARYPLTIDPSVGPETFASPTKAANDQARRAVAFDGTNYLVVWTDDSAGSGAEDLYGARVTKAGTVLDAVGIPISTAAGAQLLPAIAFDGTNYLVVWQDNRSGNHDVYGARVNTVGSVLDPTGILISPSADNNDYAPALAFDGTNYLVTWTDFRNFTNDIYGARVSKAGTVLDPSGVAISTAANEQSEPAVAFDGTNYLVVWNDARTTGAWHVYGTRLSKAASVLDPGGIDIAVLGSGASAAPAIAFDGTDYLVAWTLTTTTTGGDDVYGTRVSTAGAVLDPTGFAISTATGDQFLPAIAFDGTNYLVAWGDARAGFPPQTFAARVTPAGTVLDANGIEIMTARDGGYWPAVAFDGTNYLVVSEDLVCDGSSGCDVYGARVSKAATVVDPGSFVITTAANDQLDPAVAFDGTNYLVVWDDRRSGVDAIYAARVTKTGALLDPEGIRIYQGSGDAQFHPTVAYGGGAYLVAWDESSGTTNSNDIYGAMVFSDGSVISPTHISVAPGSQIAPKIAFGGTNFLVVWEDRRSGTDHDIYGARMDTISDVLDPLGFPISVAAGEQVNPSVAFDGTDYLVAWEDHRSGTSADIYGTRVTKTRTVLDPSGIPISTATGDQTAPSVASDGTNSLVVWDDTRSGNHDIYGTRVTNTGTVLSPSGTPISTAPNDQSLPAVAFNASYLVIWNDRRTGTSHDIYGARVNTSGAVQDASGFAIATNVLVTRQPTATKGDGNKWDVAYQRNGSYGNGIFTRTVAPK